MSETTNSRWILIEPENKSSIPPLEAGSYAGRCIQVIDLGTHMEQYKGEKEEKPVRKVRIVFELPDELVTYKEENGQEPRMIGIDYPFSFHKKANLRKFLETWRGREFTEEELQGFDISKLLWVPGLVQVAQYTNKEGNTRSKISTVWVLPKSMQCAPQVNTSVLYTPVEHNAEIFAKFPEWIQKEICSSQEWKDIDPMGVF